MTIRPPRIVDMRLWILSDLHIELTRGWDLPTRDARPAYDVLIVAGDLVPRAERGVRWLLDRVPDRPVIYIMGNHESYGTDIDRTLEKAKAAATGSNVHVLQDETIQIGEVTFVGATLWTDFALFGDTHRAMVVAAERMNDFRKIRTGRYLERFRPLHALARHRRSREFIEAGLRQKRSGPMVVVTHHAPHPAHFLRSTSDPLVEPDILTSSYRSDLTSLLSAASDSKRNTLQPADLWIYGHTHESFDAMVGETRVVSNAKGYGPWLPRPKTWDNPDFNPNLIVNL
jgi:predicted phosphodiesterase